MSPAFFCGDESSSNLYSFCPKHKRSCHTSSVSNSSCCNDWNVYGVRHLGNKNHCCRFSNMSSCFCSFCNHSVSTTPLHSFCKSYRSNNRNHLYSGFLPHSHILFRISCSCCNSLYSFFRNNFSNFICIWAHQHNVYAKRFLCSLFYFPNLLSYPFCRSAGCANQSKSSCFGYSCRQMIFCHPCHTALDNGIFNSK